MAEVIIITYLTFLIRLIVMLSTILIPILNRSDSARERRRTQITARIKDSIEACRYSRWDNNILYYNDLCLFEFRFFPVRNNGIANYTYISVRCTRPRWCIVFIRILNGYEQVIIKWFWFYGWVLLRLGRTLDKGFCWHLVWYTTVRGS